MWLPLILSYLTVFARQEECQFAYSFLGVAMVTADKSMALSHSVHFFLARVTLGFADPILVCHDRCSTNHTLPLTDIKDYRDK